jgi:hypothetical protein
VELSRYEDDELIGELEARGYSTYAEDNLKDDELKMCLSFIDRVGPEIGSEMYFLREKINKRIENGW